MARFTSSAGIGIHYRVSGDLRDRPPMVLVHGWGSDAEGNWQRTGWIDALADLRTLVRLDVRGHGRSDKPLDPARYGYADMSRDVLDLMDHLGVERADFLGYSMGAFMGAWLLGHHRDRFTTFTLGGIGFETPESMAVAGTIAEALRAPDADALSDPVARGYRAFVDADPAMDATGREALAVSALRMWPDGDPLALGGPGLSDVDIPVLMVVGGADTPYIDTVERFRAAVPGARLVAVPGADHIGCVRAPMFRQAVLGLLAGTLSPGA